MSRSAKTEFLRVRVTPAEKAWADQLAEKLGVNAADLLRQALVEKYPELQDLDPLAKLAMTKGAEPSKRVERTRKRRKRDG